MCSICDAAAAGRLAEREAAEAAAVKAKEVPTSRTLTREMVLKGGPCWEYRNRFIERFPVSVEVTKELVLSQVRDWDWCWAGSYLLSREASIEFNRMADEAGERYGERVKPLYDLTRNVNAEARKLWDDAYAKAQQSGQIGWGAYDIADAVRDEFKKPYQAAQDAGVRVASEQLNKFRAEAFVTLFLADQEAYEEEHKNDPPFVEYPESDEDDDY